MRLRKVEIHNYKCLKHLEINLLNLCCIIGENNAGKSTLLQALNLALSGSAIQSNDSYDSVQDIWIELEFADITPDDLSRIENLEHRSRISKCIVNGVLVLRRTYDHVTLKSDLKYSRLVPGEDRFLGASIDNLVKGQRAGPALRTKVNAAFPEIADRVTTDTDVQGVRDAIEVYADSLPSAGKVARLYDLPTGIPQSISPLLPHVIYIQAVKNFADDMKTSATSSLGKLLSILYDDISGDLVDIEAALKQAIGKLSRIAGADGTVVDDRLDKVKQIESSIERNVQESFPHVSLSLTVLPPKLRGLFEGTLIEVNDGVPGTIDTKGDGLRRSVVFAILRTYMELHATRAQANQAQRPYYLLLFEEPELYLYPGAQRKLFAALEGFSKNHTVCLSTHSPIFIKASGDCTFVKLRKSPHVGHGKPYTEASAVELSGMTEKDQFQLICHDNNEAALFSDIVVLVEGDSDLIIFPHISAILNPGLANSRATIMFAKIGGKANFKRYKTFFDKFNVEVKVLADLDLLLSSFDQIQPDVDILKMKNALLNLVDAKIAAIRTPSMEDLRDANGKGELRAIWDKAKNHYEAWKLDQKQFEDVRVSVDEFFAWEKKHDRLQVLKDHALDDVLTSKRVLLAELRKIGVYILEKGAIEEYLPVGAVGADKVQRAMSARLFLVDRQAVCAECNVIEHDGRDVPELEVIVRGLESL